MRFCNTLFLILFDKCIYLFFFAFKLIKTTAFLFVLVVVVSNFEVIFNRYSLIFDCDVGNNRCKFVMSESFFVLALFYYLNADTFGFMLCCFISSSYLKCSLFTFTLSDDLSCENSNWNCQNFHLDG